MNLPRFTAEASLSEATERYLGLESVAAKKQRAVIPQFCYCDCRLYRYCIPLPPYGIPVCYYRQLCIPRGNCPPGYCAKRLNESGDPLQLFRFRALFTRGRGDLFAVTHRVSLPPSA